MPSLVEIGSVVLEKKIFLISSIYFHYFVIISPWKRGGGGFHLNKFESPSPKDAFCQVWLELAQSSGEEDENVKSLQQRQQKQ